MPKRGQLVAGVERQRAPSKLQFWSGGAGVFAGGAGIFAGGAGVFAGGAGG